MTLNKNQLEFFNKVVSSLSNLSDEEDPDRFLLLGCPGTGKSFLISTLTEYLISQDLEILILTPTHSSREVIRDNFNPELFSKGSLTLKTIDSGLSKTPNINDYRQLILSKGCSDSLNKFDLIIVDEISMMSENDQKVILESETTIIFTGDYNQIPPVMKKQNKLDEIIKPFWLTEQMRSTTEIEDISYKALNYQRYYPKSDLTKENLIEKFVHDPLTKTGESVYIVYRNKTLNRVNRLTREFLYPDQPPFVPGEVLLSRFNGHNIFNNQTFRIISCEHIEGHEWSLEIEPGVFIRTLTPEGYQIEMSELENLKKMCEKYKEQNNMELYNEIIDSRFSKLDNYDFVDYPYCRTVHRVQGMTFKNVYVDEEVNDSPNRRKMLYVSYSRPSDNLFTSKVDFDNNYYLLKSIKERVDFHFPIMRKSNRLKSDSSRMTEHIIYWSELGGNPQFQLTDEELYYLYYKD